MRYHDQGAFLRVTISGEDVDRFRRQWPCSGMLLRDRVSATYDARNGDLVDYTYNGRYPAPSRVDESALGALLDDGRDYGLHRINA